MDTSLLAVVAGQISSVVGCVIWAIRQEGRINGHDIKFQAADKMSDERQRNLETALTRIENKLDSRGIHVS